MREPWNDQKKEREKCIISSRPLTSRFCLSPLSSVIIIPFDDEGSSILSRNHHDCVLGYHIYVVGNVELSFFPDETFLNLWSWWGEHHFIHQRQTFVTSVVHTFSFLSPLWRTKGETDYLPRWQERNESVFNSPSPRIRGMNHIIARNRGGNHSFSSHLIKSRAYTHSFHSLISLQITIYILFPFHLQQKENDALCLSAPCFLSRHPPRLLFFNVFIFSP